MQGSWSWSRIVRFPLASLSGWGQISSCNNTLHYEGGEGLGCTRLPSPIPFDGARARASNPNSHAVRVTRVFAICKRHHGETDCRMPPTQAQNAHLR